MAECSYIVGCAVKEILKLCPSSMLVTIYKVPSFDSVDDFLQKVATVRGRLKKGGIVDTDAAARIVLHDWNEGMCGNCLVSSRGKLNLKKMRFSMFMLVIITV